MKFFVRTATIIVVAGFTSACLAPGSALGQVSLEGTAEWVGGQPIPDQELEFILPAAYGLGGLDLILNTPEDFGREHFRFSTMTNEHGEFSYDLGNRVYHVTCWLLPPVGCFPRTPPPPYLLVRVPGLDDEYYAINTYDGKFKIYTADGKERTVDSAALAELFAHYETDTGGDRPHTVGVLDLQFAPPDHSLNRTNRIIE